jgi:hypothetical protein
VPGRCRKLWPASSRKRSARPSRRAFFFERHPLPPRPGGDGGLVALPGPGRRALDGEAMRPQRSLEIAEVIAHAELPPDQRRDALQGPALSSKARCRCAARQEPVEPRPGAGVEARRPPGSRSGAQPAPALLLQDGGPAADAGTADAEMAGAIAACVICPWRSSAAAAKRRSSNWSGVKRAGRHSLPLISTTHDNAGRWNVNLLP